MFHLFTHPLSPSEVMNIIMKNAWRNVGRKSELCPSALVLNSLYTIIKEYLTLSEFHNMISYTPMEFVQEFLKCVMILRDR